MPVDSLGQVARSLPTVRTRSCPVSRLEAGGMSDTGGTSKLFAVASRMWFQQQGRGPRPVQASIEMRDVFSKVREGDTDAAVHLLRSSSGSMYTHDMRLHEGFALDIIEQELDAVEVVMVYLDLIDYSILETPGKVNEGQAHSAALFIMRTPHGLSSYYFNPHGHVSRNDGVYELYRTRSRLCAIRLPEAVDTWIIRHLTKCLSEQLDAEVRYASTKAHNYFGSNLQEFDRRGICYAFPFCLHCALVWDGTGALMRDLVHGRGGRVIETEYAGVKTEMSARGGGSRGIGLLLIRCIHAASVRSADPL